MNKGLITALAGAGTIIAIIAVVLGRTFALPSAPAPLAPEANANATEIPVDAERLSRNVATALTFKTVSFQPPRPYNPAPFNDFIDWLDAAFPDVHASLTRERINKHALLYTWTGRDPNRKPGLLTGHYDVVPVIPGTDKKWQHPPFDGVIADGHIWGRGALDDKAAIVTLFEAVTILIKRGFRPEQTLYLAFGHDEEVGGTRGAGTITQTLKSRGIQLDWSLDEGSGVLDGLVPGIARPVASINVAEKGYMTVELSARAEGGHSSIPPDRTAVAELAQAIVDVTNAPFPVHLSGPNAQMLKRLAPELPFLQRVAIANQWLFGGFTAAALLKSPATAATLRTTIAPTMLAGSTKENVLPTNASAVINFRLHPEETADDVLAHIRKAIANDNIAIRVLTANEASAVAATNAKIYRILSETAQQVFPDAVAVPGMTLGGTDSRHYSQIADNAYRFNPQVYTPDDIKTIHGTNERVSIDNLIKSTQFYVAFLERLSDDAK